jgi:hypothetical protein
MIEFGIKFEQRHWTSIEPTETCLISKVKLFLPLFRDYCYHNREMIDGVWVMQNLTFSGS